MIDVVIHKRSHHFMVTDFSDRARRAIIAFARKFVQWGYVRQGRHSVREPLKTFAAATANKDEFRFHINCYKDFRQALELAFVPEKNITVHEYPIPVYDEVDLPIFASWVDFPHQPPVIEYITGEIPPRAKFVDLQTGQGKAQPLTAKIKVPGGWKRMGQMEVGTKVTAPDGSVTEVLAVHPQGVKDIYEITFMDGRKTRCCDEHLWRVRLDTDPEWITLSTHKLRVLISQLSACVFVPLISFPTEYSSLLVSMDPQIKTIIQVDSELAQCITIAHPEHLYITDDYIVTHNSFCSMRANAILKSRFVLIAKPMYLEKWVIDIKKTYDIPDEEIFVIRGSGPLQALIALAKETPDQLPKVILISNTTFRNWITTYEKFGKSSIDQGYDCLPDDFMALLRARMRHCDELHQDFHANFKTDLYTNMERTNSMSATLISDDIFVTGMYELAYPTQERYKGPAYIKYIATVAFLYQFREPQHIRYMDSTWKSYSHIVLEQSLMIKRNEKSLQRYLEMIASNVREYYIKYRLPGDKTMIFCASRDMCTLVANYLKEQFSQYSVSRYIDEDDYEELMLPDIRVTTLLSAGTAVDIPGLQSIILTHAVSSTVSNVQGFGRLRQMKDGRTPLFVYWSCLDIQKHMGYHEKKREILATRTVSFKEINYSILV